VSQSRQLAAIMFTDIEGYTAIMQKDEHEAILLKDRHREIVQNEHEKNNGRIIQYYGDGTLSIFQSAVEAVQCALAMQQIFRRVPFVPVRMGIHVGDIMINDGSVFGDGVNLASRIESLGVAGCVLISDKVNDELHNHPNVRTLSMGTYQFKNIDRLVEVFALDDKDLIKPLANSLKGKTKKKHAAHSADAGKKYCHIAFRKYEQ
jgi:adenylate cyclase